MPVWAPKISAPQGKEMERIRDRRLHSGTVRRWPTLFALIGVAGIVVSAVQSTNPKMDDVLATPPKSLGNPDNSSFATRFADQFRSWKSTEKMEENTLFGGSGFRDYLADSPNLVVMWAGYPFANEYNQARGHFYAVDDVKGTKRRNDKTPATCWSCKSPGVPAAMSKVGVAAFYGQAFTHFMDDMKNPIGCADCHEPKTMKLQISRPALIEGFKVMGKDVTKATKDEMRSLVCAQCHVEYHFKGPDKYLKFPWNFGLKAEDFDRYYMESGHTDWTHAISGAKMVKMQHPDYEVYQQSLHGKRGVSCADCHMPAKKEGKKEFTDHQIRSPLYMVDRTCMNCHDWTPDQARERVFEIQRRNKDLLERAERVLTAAHFEIGDAKKLGAGDDELEASRKLVSRAQMYWDYVAATNGMGFHAPQESARVLGKAVEIGQEARLEAQALRMKKGATGPLALPDISTKAKAQELVKTFLAPAK